MRAALQIEAEHDGADGHPLRQMRNQRVAMVTGDKRLGTMRSSANAVIARMEVIFQAGKRSMMVQISTDSRRGAAIGLRRLRGFSEGATLGP